jgi:hypothetical protein
VCNLPSASRKVKEISSNPRKPFPCTLTARENAASDAFVFPVSSVLFYHCYPMGQLVASQWGSTPGVKGAKTANSAPMWQFTIMIKLVLGFMDYNLIRVTSKLSFRC